MTVKVTCVDISFKFLSKDILDSTDKEWKDVDDASYNYRTGNVNVNPDTTKGLSTPEENKAG